ncbi:CHAT domain-containing protein [Streptomyces sp. DSM 44915]|uniref:CHAT domain-containing protein n=1 Tax=Streptomyces chisholmiae TaxID=3075540 RepID=A0ABU2JVV3_9ACTN|nr:CHAT domain-containing protein [Streptomyces sp. DSM 44915]MDT0268669.1 CHAT domain-containing protein [Streptomyces sp. DSM 44915]
MADRNQLLADLRCRVASARDTGDASALRTADAARVAATLTPVVGPATDLESAVVLGWYHWTRYRPGAADEQEDLVQAVRFLAPVHARHPGAVPDELAEVYAGTERDGVDAEAALEFGVLLTLAYERDNALPVLRRATDLFRIAVAGPLPQPLDRAMALNNLGNCLRMAYESTGEDASLDEAVAVAREAAEATSHPEHPMLLSNLGLALFQLFTRDGDATVLDEATTVGRRAVVATRPGHPQLVRYRTSLGVLRSRWAELYDDAAAGAEAITLFRLAVSATPARDPACGPRLLLLGKALDAQFRRFGDMAHLHEAIAVVQQAVAVSPEGHPAHSEAVGLLAQALARLGSQTDDVGLLRAAVATARTAVGGAEAARRAWSLYRLSWCLQSLAEALPEETAVSAEAVAVGRQAVAADPAETEFRHGLAKGLLGLFQHGGEVGGLLEAADLARSVVAATPRSVPDFARRANNLVFTLFRVHDAIGDNDILWEAISVGRAAVAAMPDRHRDRAPALSFLGMVLIRSFEHTGRTALAEEAIAYHREAVATSGQAPDRVVWLANLGMALASFARNGGSRAPAEEAVTILREALGGMPEGHHDRATALNNLAHALLGLSSHVAEPLVVLRDAVRIARAAVAATPSRHPHRTLHLNGLNLVLQILASHTGDSALVRAAVAAGREACVVAPRRHAHRAMFLGNLASALQMSFARAGRNEDITEAIEACREGLATLPRDHPFRVRLHQQLAQVTLTRALWGHDAALLEEATEACRVCVAAVGNDGAPSLVAQSLLVKALLLNAVRKDDGAPLHEAVTHTRALVSRTEPGLPAHADALHQHGSVLFLLYEWTGEPGLLVEALSVARSMVGDGLAEPELRIWAHGLLAAEAESVEAVSSAEAIVSLLPQIGRGALDLGDRGQVLGDLGALAPVVASAALSAGRPAQAVELLEGSRGVLTAESVAAVGADLDRLRAVDPGLAATFLDLRNRRAALDWPLPTSRDSPVTPEARAVARSEAQTAWQALLRRIRAQDGCADFLMPPRAAGLTSTAAEGPVVYVYAAPRRCDALVLTGDPDHPVSVVPLHDLRDSDVVRQVKALAAAVDRSVDPYVDPMARRAAQAELLEVLAWLWDTVAEPVLAALGRRTPPAAGQPWPRLWWCPVGNLAYLPLHAAGHHRDLADGSAHRAAPRTVLDRVVSSYTATARGLARARAVDQQDRPDIRTAVIAVPDAPGVATLPNAAAEAALLAGLVPGATVLSEPTRASVLAALPDHPIVHLACHHEPARIDPWQGQLVLPDHQHDPLTVADIAALRLNGGLAYLSACSTTLTRFADEALHLTGAFQLSGYPHVVGTLWPVGDRPAQQLAADFYGRLTQGGRVAPDPTHAATALHHAVRALRAKFPLTPTTWVAHTHTGA